MIYKRTDFKKALPVWVKGARDDINRTIAFRAECPNGNFTLNICAQNDYQLFINGKFVFSGPARAGRGYFRVDRLDIQRHLTRDKNELLVLVCAYRCNNFYLMNQEPFFCAELYDKELVFCATGSSEWRAYDYSQKLQRVQRYAFQRPFVEVYDFTRGEPLTVFGEPLELESFKIDTFIEREVSYPELPFESFLRTVECGKVEMHDTSRHFSPWWLHMIGKECTGFKNEELEICSTDIADRLVLSTDGKGEIGTLGADRYQRIEMKCNITGFVRTELECTRDTSIYMLFDELLIDGKLDYSRMECANVIIFKLKGGKKYELITAEPYTFKYMDIISISGEVKISSLGVIRTDFNESEIIRTIRPDADEQIKRIYASALETFRQNTYDIYMDCPSRERAGWLCDSFFTSRVEHLMSGKSTVEHSFLSNFMMEEHSLLPEGMLPMCYPADHTDGNFIPNWAMWYVLELREYLKRTNDREFVIGIRDKLYALLDYFRGFENERGLLAHLKGWIFVEWSRCNSLTQDINYPTNMLYCAFKDALGELYDDPELQYSASTLREVIRDEARIGEFFCDNAIRVGDGSYSLSGELTETCQYYAFFCGVATPERDTELWSTMINDFGSKRRLTGKWENIHFSNAFIGNYLRLELLARAGLNDELEADIRGYFDHMSAQTGTLWENDTPSASCNHGFASHVLAWLDHLGYLKAK